MRRKRRTESENRDEGAMNEEGEENRNKVVTSDHRNGGQGEFVWVYPRQAE